MAWDLRGALLKKAEVESARLADFDFRLRARTMAGLAEALGLDAGRLIGLIAEKDDGAILTALVVETGKSEAEIGDDYARARAAAERKLIDELGDPSPHRLA